MLGISPVMSSVIQKLRVDEINVSKAYRKLLVWALLLCSLTLTPTTRADLITNKQLYLALTPINLAPVVTFAVYVVIAIFWKDESLLAAKAFTSVTLISLLTTPVILFIQALPLLFQSIGSLERVQEYCKSDTAGSGTSNDDLVQDKSDIALQRLESLGGKATYASDGQPILLRGQGFAWAKDKPAVLKNLDIKIQRGKVTAVVGRVGSGKSAFLNALLGEMISTSPVAGAGGQQSMSGETMVYCAQEPWLENKTVRQNIIGVSPYDKKWYNSVIYACGLDTDLRQLHRGDQTTVGSTGQNLSGGQKQRVVS